MRVEIIDITDRSGSMNDIRDDIIGGFNAMLAEQKAFPGEARLTYVQFDDQYELNYAGKDIRDVPNLTTDTYVPRGGTALLDAIGRTLNEQGERIKKDGWAEKVVVCIRTDGQENRSREYKLDQVKAMITHAQEHGWTFIFSAADQDAFAAGGAMGISAAHTSGYSKSDPMGTMRSYQTMSASIGNIRTSGQQTTADYQDFLAKKNQV